jgi:hypothetical protein
MSSGLDPVILRKLEAFSLRRRKLIILRGVLAAIGMLLATMTVVALIDWLFILPDWVRWSLSGAAYVAVLVTEWRACVRLLVHSPDPRRLARLVEHGEPGLREDLLSAVELGEGDATLDSEQFRNLVQTDVARRIERVDMDRLLPVRLLRRTLTLTAVVITACVVVFAVSGFQFSTLLMRAMLPMANLARVSKVKVKIVEPSPADAIVAQGDSVPLVIELGGQRANKAVLETFTRNGGREIVPMTAVGPDRFTANVQIAREDVSYRIRAGDALTRKYDLRARPRPHVVRFYKKYIYPEYAGLTEHSVTEDTGEISGLEGSEVEIQIEPDQAVRTAELVVEQGKEVVTHALAPSAEGRLGTRIALSASGVYRVRLVASETGFENKFSPEYELRAEPDLVPQIELERPKRDLILPANEVVDIRATASDDLGVTKVTQVTRVNEGEWKETVVDIAKGKPVAVSRLWDLYDEGLKPGDLLTFKLRVFDLKGHQAESRAIRMSITSSGFESKRLTSLDAQRQLLVSLKALRAAGETLENRARESRDAFERLGEGDPQRKQALGSFDSALADFESVSVTAMNELRSTLRGSTPGHSTGEFVLLGRLLGRTGPGAAQNARDLLLAITTNESAGHAKELLREAADQSHRAAQRAKLAEQSARVFVTSETVDVLNENMEVVAREQERISTLAQAIAEDATKWGPLVTRLRVVLSQTKGLEEMMTAAGEYGTDGVKDRLRRMQRDLEKHRTKVDQLLETGSTGKPLAEALRLLTKFTGDLRRTAFDLKRDSMEAPARSVQTLIQEVQPTWTNFEKLRTEAESLLRNDRIDVETKGSLARARWDAKVGIFKTHGDAEESRPDSDSYFVSDLRTGTLALTGLREPVLGTDSPFTETNPAAKSLKALDHAFRILEGAHNLAEAHDGLIRLATAERWELTALRARTANPRDWEWIESRLKAFPEELNKLRLSDDVSKEAVKQAQGILREAAGDAAWKNVNSEMKERMRPEATPRPMSQDSERVAVFVKRALDALREPVQNARETLTQLVPTLPELMAQLAKEAEELKRKSQDQAEKATETQPHDAQADARRQLAQQTKLNDKVDALRDALRSEANKQDMLEKEGRERARDADDALAMLKDPPPDAAEALEEAVAAAEPSQSQEAFQQASAEQQKLANALNRLSEHFKALEQGNAEQTRLALREAEKELGVKDALDQRYAQAEQLAQLAQSTPQQMLEQLEKALPQNPLMQQELSGIAKDTLKSASDRLNDASRREAEISKQIEKLATEQLAQANQAAAQKAAAEKAAAEMAAQQAAAQSANSGPPQTPPSPSQEPSQQAKAPADPSTPQPDQTPQSAPKMAQSDAPSQGQNPESNAQSPPQVSAPALPQPSDPKLAQAATQQAPIAQAAMQAGDEVARAGRHEQRLQNSTPGQQLEQLGNEIVETAKAEIAQAQSALQNAASAEQAKAPVNAASAELRSEAAQLAQVQAGAMQAATPGGQPASPPSPSTPGSPSQDVVEAAQKPQSGPPQSPQGATAQAQSPQSTPAGAAQQAGASSGTPQPPAGAQTPAQAGQATAQAAPGAPPQAQAASTAGSPQEALAEPQISSAPANPQQQVWMARTLDLLDAAMNATTPQVNQEGTPGGEQQTAGQQPGQQPGAQQPQQQQPGQNGQQQPSPNANALAQAQQAMNAAAQAAAAAARASRSEQSQAKQPSSQLAQGDQQAASETGAMAEGGEMGKGALPNAQLSRTADWGKLPKKVAEQLTQGQREAVAGEYRNQVETYYRVIAERAKKP